MGGDGLDGLAAAIFGAMVCMVVLPALLAGGVGYLVARRRRGWLGAVVGVVLGAGLGAIAVMATFYESTWSPPPTLTLDASPGFAHEWVYVVGDPRVTTEIVWSGHELPFTSRHAALSVPASGVVRVRSVDGLERGDVAAILGPARSVGFAALNAPPALGGARVVAFGFAPWPGREPSPPDDPVALAARLAELEAER